jgi:hypothetical protein
MRGPEVIDPMTRKPIPIHREAGLSHQRIAALTQTSARSVQRVLAESEPTTLSCAACPGSMSRLMAASRWFASTLPPGGDVGAPAS